MDARTERDARLEKICDGIIEDERYVGSIEAVYGGNPMKDRQSWIALASDLRSILAEPQSLLNTAEARVLEMETLLRAAGRALEPFVTGAQHLHPSLPDDGLTLDGIEVRHWRKAVSAFYSIRKIMDRQQTKGAA